MWNPSSPTRTDGRGKRSDQPRATAMTPQVIIRQCKSSQPLLRSAPAGHLLKDRPRNMEVAMGGVRMVKVAMAFTPGWLVGQFRTALTSILLVFWVVAGITAPAQSRDAIDIGISQFPSTMHPNIDSMLAKNYVGYMTRRPFKIGRAHV